MLEGQVRQYQRLVVGHLVDALRTSKTDKQHCNRMGMGLGSSSVVAVEGGGDFIAQQAAGACRGASSAHFAGGGRLRLQLAQKIVKFHSVVRLQLVTRTTVYVSELRGRVVWLLGAPCTIWSGTRHLVVKVPAMTLNSRVVLSSRKTSKL